MENATKMEKAQKFKEAERLYLAVDKVDHAIAMYKKHRKFQVMIGLVEKYRKELLGETHKYLAQQLEMEGNLKDAEDHYASAGEWLAAVNMYRTNDLWEEVSERSERASLEEDEHTRNESREMAADIMATSTTD